MLRKNKIHHDFIDDARTYIDSYHSAQYFTDSYSYLETIAFWVVVIFTLTFQTIGAILTFITAPVWFVPYLIYKRIKLKGDKK